jgi:hypothetical protein
MLRFLSLYVRTTEYDDLHQHVQGYNVNQVEWSIITSEHHLANL